MKTILSPKQVALAIGVSEASLKRWCDKGLLPTQRTAGGHRRLPISGVMRFIRECGHPLVRPEVLGLPSASGSGDTTIDRCVSGVCESLEAGDVDCLRRIAMNLFLAGHTLTEIFDLAIAPAFEWVGQRWQHGDLEVYRERRGCEICLQVFYEMRLLLPNNTQSAPHAIGGTLEHDPYTLPTQMVEIALRENGWRAQSLGSGHPATTLAAAIRVERPSLFWLSVSALPSDAKFLTDYTVLTHAAAECGVPLAVGGRALTEDLRREMEYTAYCDNVRHLASFARSIAPSSSSGQGTAAT